LKGNRLRVSLRVTPGAKRNQVATPKVDAGGQAALGVKVTAVAEGGKANAAVIKLLAKRWKVAAGRFTVISGTTSRQKVIEISEGDRALLDRINDIETTHGRQAYPGEDIG
jgi:uncharacterized protein (TIGR00251 family)